MPKASEKTMNQNPQKAHYEKIHEDYSRHYYDPTSMKFRDAFIYKYLFKGIDLNGKKVADLACGSGYNSLYLKKYYPKIQVFGFDISNKACQDYEKIVERPATEIDLTKKNTFDATLKEQFDCVLIMGAIHHCVENLPETFRNIHSILKPGGYLLMFEPNKYYFLEGMRKAWYRWDRYFEADTEEALDHTQLLATYSHLFDCENVAHLGGPAYFLIYNSLLFRIPIKLKQIISYPLFALERLYNLLPGRFMYPYFIARWRKK
jgi:SAM-dependent methyltransferase